MSAPVIELRGVGFAYPGTAAAAVGGIDLAIAPGELVAVIGPSGCGKSTLLRLIAGFLEPREGAVLLGGADVSGVPARERNLGVVFQTYALFPHMAAWENVAYPLKVRGVAAGEQRRRALAMLERVGLSALADRRPPELSGGQQQRVALARALVFSPRALLLDEPLSALDAALRIGMRDEIRRLQRSEGIATLHVTHDQEEALSIADRVVVMRAGRIEQIAPPRELYERPASRAVAAFVGHANLLDGTVAGPDSVDTPIGRLATMPHGLPPGVPVTILIRPERVRLGAPPDGVNGFTGSIAQDRFLGSVRRFDLSVAGGVLVAETAQPGDVREVHVPAESVHIIPGNR
ncbi:ABC transporter ATP-binding protein [Azospirillum sp.]|uniref:ABC transporter ATP-binding protein n=1 Tax=Azospirillum sp. TaxID=34012 RepID=UPI003D74F4B8